MHTQLENLQRRSDITKKSCYHAAKRLNHHDTLSLFSLTTLAFVLIVVSLVTQLYGSNSFIAENEKVFDISMTTASIFALMMSLIVQKSNFSLKADSFQRQGREINELRISFKHLIGNQTTGTNNKKFMQKLYERKSRQYAAILERHLVHDDIDYHITRTTGIEKKYHVLKLILTEYVGYLLIICISLAFLAWICNGTYIASEEAIKLMKTVS